MFGARPEQSINFISVHDNLCLRDRILQWAENHGQSANTGYLARIQEFGTGIILTSQGIPLISEGDEFLRDKDSLTDREKAANSYNVSDPVNTIHWGLRVQHEDIYNYFKKTIALRRAHPGFRLTSWEAVNRDFRSARRYRREPYQIRRERGRMERNHRHLQFGERIHIPASRHLARRDGAVATGRSRALRHRLGDRRRHCGYRGPSLMVGRRELARSCSSMTIWYRKRFVM
jgi:pullulanase/glycogen debranching enzyme